MKEHIRYSTTPVKMILSTPKKHNPFGQYFQNLIFSALFKAFLVPNKKKDIAKYEWE